MHKARREFTIIELLIVVTIIGLLAMIVVMNLNKTRVQSRDARRTSDIKTIQSALELYYSDNGSYPINTKGECISAELGVGRFLEDGGTSILVVPKDPLWPNILPSVFNNNTINDYPISTSNNFCYWYYGGSDNYYLSYYLESISKAGNPGIYVASINN